MKDTKKKMNKFQSPVATWQKYNVEQKRKVARLHSAQ